ncbi:hypothetical protein BBFGKLBO_01100 [Synechococcus sp. CBW1107]|nr:hypothetical protein BBFGKLBO_01100 [Synechococcus sp. CBW1107]
MPKCHADTFSYEKMKCQEGLRKLRCYSTMHAVKRGNEVAANRHLRELSTCRLVASLTTKRDKYFLRRAPDFKGGIKHVGLDPLINRELDAFRATMANNYHMRIGRLLFLPNTF